MSNLTNPKIPNELARLCKNPRSEDTRHTLRRIYQQKLHGKQYIGVGNAPTDLINMPLNLYMKRLREIQVLLTRRLLTFTQLSFNPVTPSKYNATWMLKTLMPKIQIYPYYLIKDHIAVVYLPEYGIILDDCAHMPYKDGYQLQMLPISAQQLGIQITKLSASLKNKKLPKLEHYRIMKLYRDICMDTIAFWISETDIYQLLLMNEMDDVSIRMLKFHSPIFQVNGEKMSEKAA